MKIAPPSGDLLIKLGLAAGLGLVGLYLVNKLTSGAASLVSTASNAADALGTGLNVTSPDNYAYRVTNVIGAGMVSDPAGPGKNADGSWNLGAWIYDITHRP